MDKQNDDLAEEIIKRNSDTVYKLAFSKTQSKADAEDIFQEVFLRYFRKKPIFNDRQHEKAWFIKVTVNCSYTFFSSWWQKNTNELNENIQYESAKTLEVLEEIRKLPIKYRQVVHLFYYEGYSTIEIAEILNRKESTIRTQLTRARFILKKVIKEEENNV